MGRRLSAQHHQSLVDEWSRQIRAIQWSGGGLAADLVRLASLIGVELGQISPKQRALLKAALIELRAALGSPRAGRQPEPRVADLEEWINRYLVERGDRLLITEDRRRAQLVRLRDGDRRQAHAQRGLRSARVEMPEESWKKLRRLAVQKGTLTLGQTLALVISDYAGADKVTGFKKRRSRDQKNMDILNDILTPLIPRNRDEN
jgi:hypothetical protein